MGYQGGIENEPHFVTIPALPLVVLPPCLIKINFLILVLQSLCTFRVIIIRAKSLQLRNHKFHTQILTIKGRNSSQMNLAFSISVLKVILLL